MLVRQPTPIDLCRLRPFVRASPFGPFPSLLCRLRPFVRASPFTLAFHTGILSHACGFMISWWRCLRDNHNFYIRNCHSDLVLQSEDCRFRVSLRSLVCV
eukprot:4520959-Amphidinium_carterae.4